MSAKVTKREYMSKGLGNKECGHWEGNFWCDCKVRGYRVWLGIKKFGHQEQCDDEQNP